MKHEKPQHTAARRRLLTDGQPDALWENEGMGVSVARVGLACLASLVTVPGCVVWPQGAGPAATPVPLAEALALRDRGEAVLVDVRSREAYAEGHLPGSVNIPASQVEERAAEIRRMGRLPILYCG